MVEECAFVNDTRWFKFERYEGFEQHSFIETNKAETICGILIFTINRYHGPIPIHYPFEHLDRISPRPVLLIAGENANSLYFSKDAYAKTSEPKEPYIVPKATHVDLYDQVEIIQFIL